MITGLRWVFAAWFAFLAVAMFFVPKLWYQSTPGVPEMGPFNMHFVMDIGLVFFVSAVCLGYGALSKNQTAMICGALWPALHATFHIYIWFDRGMPFDLIAASNLFGIQLPAWGALYLAQLDGRRG